MEYVLLRILSLILSALMFFFNTFSAIFPGLFPSEPIENIANVYDAELFEADESAVVSDFATWYVTADRDSDAFDKYDWKYFFRRSVALIYVVLPDSGCTIEVVSVKESGNILNVEYRVVKGSGEYAAVECPMVILVETSKNITLISATNITEKTDPVEPSDPEIPDDPKIPEESYQYSLYSSDNFDSYLYNGMTEIISTFDDWAECYIGSDSELDIYNEAYFEEKNLALIYIKVPSDGKTIQIVDITNPSDTSINVKFRVQNGESEYGKGFWVVAVETSKDIKHAYSYEIGLKGESAIYNIEMFNEEKLTKKDGSYEIISTYESWEELKNSYYMSEYNFTKAFFEDSSLAVISVMLPNRNYEVEVNSQTENGNILELSYTTHESEYGYYENPEVVVYKLIVAEISKNITQVTATETMFKNPYNVYYSAHFSGMSEDVQLVTDYETWSDVRTSSSTALSKYNEEYFENYSVVLISETMPDSGHDFDIIKLKENGNTLEVVYGVNDVAGGGLTVLEYKTLLIEVSKNITSVSAERKDTDNYYKIYGGLKKFNLEEEFTDEAYLISDYTTWKKYLNSDSTEFDKYNEEYFEDNSVVLIRMCLPSSATFSKITYLYEDESTLNAGYYELELDTMGGTAIICYQTVLVEVSKDVTEVQLTELE